MKLHMKKYFLIALVSVVPYCASAVAGSAYTTATASATTVSATTTTATAVSGTTAPAASSAPSGTGAVTSKPIPIPSQPLDRLTLEKTLKNFYAANFIYEAVKSALAQKQLAKEEVQTASAKVYWDVMEDFTNYLASNGVKSDSTTCFNSAFETRAGQAYHKAFNPFVFSSEFKKDAILKKTVPLTNPKNSPLPPDVFDAMKATGFNETLLGFIDKVLSENKLRPTPEVKKTAMTNLVNAAINVLNREGADTKTFSEFAGTLKHPECQKLTTAMIDYFYNHFQKDLTTRTASIKK
jgi:hypothetical protein